jgi:hypothetical protein
MKRNFVKPTGNMKGHTCITCEPLMIKLSRAMNSGEPIDSSAELAQTERKDGVLPQYDIRTDRFEKSLETYDAITKAHLAKREDNYTPKMEVLKNEENDTRSSTKSTDGDSNSNNPAS